MYRKTIRKTSDEVRAKAVDLFSGCGGLTLGLKHADFDVIAAIEKDKKACTTYKLNHPDVRLYHADIRDVSASDLMADLGLARGELHLLAGCPPCQGFSRLRTRNKSVSVEDQRNDLVDDFVRFVEDMLPKTVMLENVPALGLDLRFSRLRERLQELGYEVCWDTVDAAGFGVPQRRKRLILLASRVHQPQLAAKTEKRLTVREVLSMQSPSYLASDALHTLGENRSPKVRALIAAIPKDGGSRAALGDALQLPCHKKRAGFSDVYGRMRWDDVAPTMTSGCHNPSKGRFLHPQLDRTITLREAALFQGFPVDYKFCVEHGKEAIALMIGNALPPPLISAHAKSLRSALN